MKQHTFDTLARTFAGLSSRRRVLRGLAGIALALSAVPHSGSDARKRNKPRKRQAKQARQNAYGCLAVGDACKNAGQCCSGICAGKKERATCRAHGEGTCPRGELGYCGTGIPISCNNTISCVCFGTTAGSNFCGDIRVASGGECADCTKDADCAALGFPPGSACVPASLGPCAGMCESGMICIPPCPATVDGRPTPDDDG